MKTLKVAFNILSTVGRVAIAGLLVAGTFIMNGIGLLIGLIARG